MTMKKMDEKKRWKDKDRGNNNHIQHPIYRRYLYFHQLDQQLFWSMGVHDQCCSWTEGRTTGTVEYTIHTATMNKKIELCPSVQDNGTRTMRNQAILVIVVFRLHIRRAALNGHSLQQSCVELYKKQKKKKTENVRMLWLYLRHTEHVWQDMKIRKCWQLIGPYLTPRIIIFLQKLLHWTGCPHSAILWYCCRLSCRTFPPKVLGTFGPE